VAAQMDRTERPPRPGRWQVHAACVGIDPTLFVGVEGEIHPEKVIREREAKKICDACPVKSACLEHALTYEEGGIWGGTDEKERRRMLGRSRSYPLNGRNNNGKKVQCAS
jgi:WhiB family redox-sensing transcriptional regulator